VRGCNVSASTPSPRTCECEAIRLRPRSSFASPTVEMACYKRKYLFMVAKRDRLGDVRTMLDGFLFVLPLNDKKKSGSLDTRIDT